jgi:hypothetical protein
MLMQEVEYFNNINVFFQRLNEVSSVEKIHKFTGELRSTIVIMSTLINNL